MRSSLYPADELRRRTHAWALKLRLNPKVVRVQQMRHKWGSCTSMGTITLASDLADQESRFQDFVIVHELLHLRYSSHGRVFKALLNAYVPGSAKFDVAIGKPAVFNRRIRVSAVSGRNCAT
jgi:predicted metal-dependent hydrolase